MTDFLPLHHYATDDRIHFISCVQHFTQVSAVWPPLFFYLPILHYFSSMLSLLLLSSSSLPCVCILYLGLLGVE